MRSYTVRLQSSVHSYTELGCKTLCIVIQLGCKALCIVIQLGCKALCIVIQLGCKALCIVIVPAGQDPLSEKDHVRSVQVRSSQVRSVRFS